MRALLAQIAGEKGRGVTYRKKFRYSCSSRLRSTFIAGLSSYWLMLGSAAQIKEGKRRRASDIKSSAANQAHTQGMHTYMYAQGGTGIMKLGCFEMPAVKFSTEYMCEKMCRKTLRRKHKNYDSLNLFFKV